MEKIPTAEEILKLYYNGARDEDGDPIYYDWSIHDAMIDFAKLHVEATLQEIEIQRCINHHPPIQFINKTYLIKNIK